MPKAFCGLEMCAKNLRELCALCERELTHLPYSVTLSSLTLLPCLPYSVTLSLLLCYPVSPTLLPCLLLPTVLLSLTYPV